jgi:hypothetical protein
MIRILALAAAAAASLSLSVSAVASNAGGATVVRDSVILANGELYRTVLTPNDLSRTGAPDSSYDTLFMFDGAQMPLSSAAPGEPGYNGGRWMVRPVSFTGGYAAAAAAFGGSNGGFDHASELAAAIDAGVAHVGDVMARFSCPLIRA